jgi:3-deoxy-manno-octulosonate cytidylyltransferase (CMP-KDO synthetase)
LKAIKAIGIIPARYDSTRLPGKPLMEIGTKPMIQWVYERSSKADRISEIFVATDDERILQTVRSFGGKAIMTPKNLSSGTDRAAFLARNFDAQIIVNIQGDEPFINPNDVDKVTGLLMSTENYCMGTLVKRIFNPDELSNPNTVKVVINQQREALYFSRSPIPFSRENKLFSDWIEGHTYFKHIGIYSYRREFLLQYTGWKQTPLENMEKLEQLRVLEMGHRIHVAETDSDSICVDTTEDLSRARAFYKTYESLK